MGIQAWLRAFNGLNIFSFLPQAIAWTRAKAGHEVAEKRFLWITKWWANVAGWSTSISSILLYISLIVEGDFSLYSFFPLFRRNRWWKKNDDDDWEDFEEVALQVVGITGISVEIVSWVLFYISYPKAMAYGTYLLGQAAPEDTVSDETDIADDVASVEDTVEDATGI